MRQKKKLCLGIDTTFNTLSVALLDTERHSAYVCQEMLRRQGEILISFIQNVLSKLKKTPADLTHIAVTIGPGSFTGVRIGLATARGLGLALKIPVIGIDNFTATSFCHKNQLPHKVILDSKRDDYFIQDFDKQGHKKGKSYICSAQQLATKLPFTACGNGATKLATSIHCKLASPATIPLALAAAQIALTLPKLTTSAHPLYLREADVTV